MKFRFISVFALCVMLITGVCAKEKTAASEKAGSPGHALRTFFTAMSKSDFTTAKKYVAAKEMVQLITFLETMVKETPELKSDVKKDFEPMAKGKIISQDITGETAKIVLNYAEKKKNKKETFKLQKLKGIWKIVD